jgi:hypothetical protein
MMKMTEDQFLIINGLRYTIPRCTIRNDTNTTKVKKCIVRADWYPPNKRVSHGHAAVSAGDIATYVWWKKGKAVR